MLQQAMANEFEVRILLPQHKEAVLAYARQALEWRIKDPMELEMESWGARWRGEALDHYAPMGWSFAAFDGEQKVIGFILAQPFLFLRGLTQTLWVEYLSASQPAVGQALLDTAHRWARDKHFQCVLLEETPAIADLVREWKQRHPIATPFIELRSAKF